MTAEPNLLIISITAFIAVIVLLAILAGVIRLLTTVFPAGPEKVKGPEGPDAALLAAIHAASAHAYPGMRVTNIEETR
jgi:hypothetical protein